MNNKNLPNIPIIYEDEHCLVINKPAGVVVHPDGKASGPFLTDWILDKYPQTREVGEPVQLTDGGTIERPGIVHRIDRETSGALIIAKTAEGHASLKKQFQKRSIEKKYLAFIYGTLKQMHGAIDLPIGRSRGDFRRYNAERNSRGEMREAFTQYVVLGQDPERRFTLVEAQPKTGRTHQIRVHFKALQHPIVGDELYAGNLVNINPKALGFERMALHAYSLIFDKVWNGKSERVNIIAPIPDDFRSAMLQIGLTPEVVLDPKKLKTLPKMN